ncbi:MAG: hypothetical protein K2P81_06205 [Bacteriovoracaceae bacterium]|nr:hypothetical protein [Bacteriovoracaceae bacterium]
MKKINALLHDVTLIDFAFMVKLAKRYKTVTRLAVGAFLILTSYFYFSQTTVHSKKVFFKMTSQEDTGGGRKIDELVGDVASNFVNHNEVKAMVSNFKFIHLLAEKMVDSPNFTKLDFNSPATNSLRKPDDLFASCSSRDCKVRILEAVISGMYDIESEIGTGRFVLTVTTRSALTTTEFINYFIVAIKENRLNMALEEYEKKISHTEELINTSRKDVYTKGGFEKVASLESLEASIARQHDKMKDIIVRLNGEIHQNHFQEVRLKTSEVAANTTVGDQSKEGFEQYQAITKNIAKLKQNIESLSSIPESSRSPSDNVILGQLQTDLKKSEAELQSLGKISRNVAHEQKFIDSQMSNQTDYEFDYTITKQKLKKLQSESEKAKSDLSYLLSQKAKLDNELLALKPDLEYLKKMETKLVGLRMLKSGARANVMFEDYGPEVSSFKRNSAIKIMSFSFFFVGFFMFLALMIIYLLDDKIYDEREFEKCYEDLRVIGYAPKFD